LILGYQKFLHRIRRRREAASVLQQLRLFKCLAWIMALRGGLRRSFQGCFFPKICLEILHSPPSEGLRRHDAFL
jgi:hypothetical protein